MSGKWSGREGGREGVNRRTGDIEGSEREERGNNLMWRGREEGGAGTGGEWN